MNLLPREIIQQIGLYFDYEMIETSYRLTCKYVFNALDSYFWLLKTRVSSTQGRDRSWVSRDKAKQVCAQDYVAYLHKEGERLEGNLRELYPSPQDQSQDDEYVEDCEIIDNNGSSASRFPEVGSSTQPSEDWYTSRLERFERRGADPEWVKKAISCYDKRNLLRETFVEVVEPPFTYEYTRINVSSTDHSYSYDRSVWLVKRGLLDCKLLAEPGRLIGLHTNNEVPWHVLYVTFDAKTMSTRVAETYCYTSGDCYLSELSEKMYQMNWSADDLKSAYSLPFKLNVRHGHFR